MASDNVKIVFGIVAAAGVVLVSYMFFKIFETKPEGHKRKSKGAKSQPVEEKKATQKTSTPHSKNTQVKQKSAQEIAEVPIAKDELGFDENVGQTSFIVIDQAAGASLPGEEGPTSSKKSDRSSDESSFDVVEAGGEEDEEDKKQTGDAFEGESLQGSLPGDNESSMVIVDSDPSGLDASSSSFYHSANETMSKDPKDKQGDVTDAKTEESDASQSISTTDSDITVMHSVEGRSSRQEGASQASDSSKATGDSSIKSTAADEKTDVPTGSSLAGVKSEARESLSGKSATSAPAKGATPSKEEAKKAALQSRKTLTSSETARTIAVCQNSASTVSKNDIFNLVELLRAKNPSLHAAVVDCVVRVSVFTHNIKYLSEAGCGWVVAQQVQESCSAVVQGDVKAQAVLEELSGALTNLGIDPTCLSQLEGSVSPLIDVLLLESVSEAVQLSALRPLTNLSSETTYHPLFIRCIHQLYALIDRAASTVRLQSLKTLVNLSLGEEMVPYLLSAKAPSTLLDLVDDSTSDDLVLRTVTKLGNMYAIIYSKQLTQSSLPTLEKVESPNTMYTALFGVVELPTLRNKIYRLTRHRNKDICQQASKLYHFITNIKK